MGHALLQTTHEHVKGDSCTVFRGREAGAGAHNNHSHPLHSVDLLKLLFDFCFSM